MKMLARRSFLRALPAAPLVAKKAAEEVAVSLSRVGGLGVSQGSGSYGLGSVKAIPEAGPSNVQWLRLMGNKEIRSELESVYFERERNVSSIDPDIAVYRSFSLSAKIAYQRQRNVTRYVEGLADSEGWWGKFERFRKKAMGV